MIKRFKQDTVRIAIFGAISLLALIPMWDSSQVIFYFIGAMSLLALYSHVARRLYFPYVDMDQLAISALTERNIAAAVVFASVTALICTILFVAGSLIGFSK